jgi:hypothetical protein
MLPRSTADGDSLISEMWFSAYFEIKIILLRAIDGFLEFVRFRSLFPGNRWISMQRDYGVLSLPRPVSVVDD